MSKKILLEEKGSIVPIIINIIIILLSGSIPFFMSKYSAIIYIILLPILFIVLGVLNQIKNRNLFLTSLITFIPLGGIMFISRGAEILVYIVFYMTAIGLSYLISAISRNMLREYM